MDANDENLDSVIGLFNSIQSGVIHMTYQDYYNMPNGLSETVDFLKRILNGRSD
jgi:hypothetical protein